MPTRIPALAPAPERGLKRSMKSIRLDWLIRRPLMPISYIVWSPDLYPNTKKRHMTMR